MCRHFTALSRDDVAEIIRDIASGGGSCRDSATLHGSDAFPDDTVPVIMQNDDDLVCAEMGWGYPLPWKRELAFNARADTARYHPESMWYDSLLKRRCAVPALGFFESHRTERAISAKTGARIKRSYRFAAPDGGVLFLAGIHENDRFSLLTTEPCADAASVHDRMPVVMRHDELRRWFSDQYFTVFDRSGIVLSATPQQPLAPQAPAQESLW